MKTDEEIYLPTKQPFVWPQKARRPHGRWKAENRICFGIIWFESALDAALCAKEVSKRGITYNGGWFDGMPCGRNKSFDHEDEAGVTWYAVTF